MTLTELARLLSMPKSTAFRLITQLMESGYLERVGRRYRLSLQVLELGNHHSLCREGGLREIAAPHMGGLFQHMGLTVSLAVRSGTDIVYVDRIRGTMPGPSLAVVGHRLPLLTTALGKSILAFEEPEVLHHVLKEGIVRRTQYSITAPGLLASQISNARSTGISFDRQESQLGLVCVAAPILSPDGRAVGAISLSGRSGRFKLETAASLVARAARHTSNDLGRNSDTSDI